MKTALQEALAEHTLSSLCPSQVVDSEERAQAISRARAQNAEWHRRASLGRMVAEQQEGAEGEQRTLPVIIKADVQVRLSWGQQGCGVLGQTSLQTLSVCIFLCSKTLNSPPRGTHC